MSVWAQLIDCGVKRSSGDIMCFGGELMRDFGPPRISAPIYSSHMNNLIVPKCPIMLWCHHNPRGNMSIPYSGALSNDCAGHTREVITIALTAIFCLLWVCPSFKMDDFCFIFKTSQVQGKDWRLKITFRKATQCVASFTAAGVQSDFVYRVFWPFEQAANPILPGSCVMLLQV